MDASLKQPNDAAKNIQVKAPVNAVGLRSSQSCSSLNVTTGSMEFSSERNEVTFLLARTRKYKPKGSFLDASHRREEFLKQQQKVRSGFLDDARNALFAHLDEANATAEKAQWQTVTGESPWDTSNMFNATPIDDLLYSAPFLQPCENGGDRKITSITETNAASDNFNSPNHKQDFHDVDIGSATEPLDEDVCEMCDTGEDIYRDISKPDDVTNKQWRVVSHCRSKPHAIFGKQLVLCDWLVDIPPDLSQNWLFYLRPEGKRCLVSIFNHYAIARDKFGAEIIGFSCSFPGQGFTVIECVYNQVLGIFFISDVLLWNDCLLSNSSAECRWFFLRSRYSETVDLISKVTESNDFAFLLLDCHECDVSLLKQSYYEISNFPTDCLVFVHKEAHYIPGFNPLWLCWRDAHLSKYNIDTSRESSVSVGNQKQCICLEHMPNGDLRTAEGIVVGKSSHQWENLRGKRRKTLVRGEISGVDLATYALLDLRIVGRAHRSRIYAEPLNRIISQHIQKMLIPAITFEDVLHALVTQS